MTKNKVTTKEIELNSTLFNGDIVCYQVLDSEIERMGFVLGQTYLVHGKLQKLYIRSDSGNILYLTNPKGFLESSHNFRKCLDFKLPFNENLTLVSLK